MIPILSWAKLSPVEQGQALARAAGNDDGVLDRVRDVLARVRRDGDASLRALTATFDGYDGPLAFVASEKLDEAVRQLPVDLRRALDVAIANITQFHQAQQPKPLKIETQPGVTCELQWRPIERVGLYIPGGSAPLLSAVLMSALPARLAGCSVRILCTPPRKDGSIDPGILAAASLCGITQVLPLGGAQAIAAMAFGTETVPKVDKIYGPGNAYVTCAKQLVAQAADGAAIDMPAGPSEVMVVADAGANPEWIAADLLAQAEHGPDSQALFVTPDAVLAERVQQAVAQQTRQLSRAALVEKALNYCRILVVADMNGAMDVANLYAPEHLIVHGDDAAMWVPKIRNAGSVFVGSWTPETAGDYASGTNHVLPTYGYARAYGGLNLLSFMKNMTVQSLTQAGLAGLAPTLVSLAKAEGLDAHAAAVTLRTGLT